MMRAHPYLLAALFAISQGGAGASTAQSHLPPTVRQGAAVLELASCGIRDSLWIDHYAAGLYLQPKAEITAVTDPNAAKAVRLKMISMRFVPETVPEKWLDALTRSLPPQPLSQVRRAYRGLSDGDVMTIAYLPRRGVVVEVNGKAVTRVKDHAVIDAVLSAWAGTESVQDKLRALVQEHAC